MKALRPESLRNASDRAIEPGSPPTTEGRSEVVRSATLRRNKQGR